jgi:formylglycine-generating enzyme required for sulfatase activity
VDVRAGEEERQRATLVERVRVENAIVGIWSDSASRLTITRAGSRYQAEYLFVDPGPFSTGGGRQVLDGELGENNELNLTNRFYGKLANPAEYFPGDFSTQASLALSADGQELTARISGSNVTRTFHRDPRYLSNQPANKPNESGSLSMMTASKSDTRVGVNQRDGLTYIWIPPGTFEMGCGSNADACAADEVPAHSVTVSKGFWMGQRLVTAEAFRSVLMRRAPTIGDEDFAFIQRPDAEAYCKAIGMRLPTEAEWEYVAKGGPSELEAGDIPNPQVMPRTEHTGLYPQDNLGFHDLRGEVWQWVSDWYGAYQPDASIDPQGPAEGQHWILRGGFRGLVDRASVRGTTNSSNPGLIWTEATRACSMITGFRCVGNDSSRESSR